jgi:hypothetical protein
MENSGGLIIFGIIFLVLCGAAVGLGHTDVITPAMSQAQASLAVGAPASMTFETLFAMLFKGFAVLIGLGVSIFLFMEGPKLYRTWKRAQTRRWVSGPNAQWKRIEPKSPHLTRNDLMFFALANRDGIKPEMLNRSALQQFDDDEDLNLEI